MRIRMPASKGRNWYWKQRRSCGGDVKDPSESFYFFVSCILQWSQRDTGAPNPSNELCTLARPLPLTGT